MRERRSVRPRTGRATPRLPVVVGLGAVLVAGGLVDRFAGQAPAPASAPTEPLPVAAPAAALSSTWLCAGATAAPGSAAAGVLVVANAGARAVTATVTLVPDKGPRATLPPVTVPAASTVTIPEQAAGGAGWLAAEVLLDGGAAAVDQLVAGPAGASVTGCATSGAASWYFPTGETLVNATETIDLFNPYGSDAIVDMSFGTDQGTETPGDFQSIDVPPDGLVAVDLGSHLRRRTAIATAVHARAGRVVATSTELVSPPAPGQALLGAPADPANPTSADPADPVAGATVQLGVSAPSTSATWPDGVTGDGLDERWTVFNPSSQPADVSLAVRLDQGQAEPLTFVVGAGQATTVDANAEARIPPGVGHAATVRVTNGVGVVAARSLIAAAPAAGRGRGVVAADPVAARSWLVPAGARQGVTGRLAVATAGAAPATVRVTVLGAGGPVGAPEVVTVPAGGRAVLPLTTASPALAGLLVQSSTPVFLSTELAASAPQPSFEILQLGVPLG